MSHIPCISSVPPLLPSGLGLPSSGLGSLISGTPRGRDAAHTAVPHCPAPRARRGDVYILVYRYHARSSLMVARLSLDLPIKSPIAFSRFSELPFGSWRSCMNSTAYLLLCPLRCAMFLLLALSPRVFFLVVIAVLVSSRPHLSHPRAPSSHTHTTRIPHPHILVTHPVVLPYAHTTLASSRVPSYHTHTSLLPHTAIPHAYAYDDTAQDPPSLFLLRHHHHRLYERNVT
ncbi:hypothetical protein C8T65DRAFT_294262 [Cerioporus squamosus]|nr:hypothetical protein C8T65DRAFT_294262 [Cerioporus squamosus]